MLIVILAMLELVALPAFYTAVAPDQPIVHGAAMGMTVKTDRADAAIKDLDAIKDRPGRERLLDENARQG